MLTSSELSAMQTTLDASLPDTGVIQRLTTAPDGQGGVVETWAAVGTAACRVSPQFGFVRYGSAERIEGQRLTEVDYWTVTFPDGTDVDTDDRIVTSGRTLEAVAVMAPRSWELCRRLVCTEVDT